MLQRIGRGWGLTKASWAMLKVPPKPLRLGIVSELILPGPILSGPILSGPILSGPIRACGRGSPHPCVALRR